MDLIEELLKIRGVKQTPLDSRDIAIYKIQKGSDTAVTFVRSNEIQDSVFLKINGTTIPLRNLEPETILDLFKKL